MIEIEKSSGNVYVDLGSVDADAMQVKARLASKIAESSNTATSPNNRPPTFSA